MKAKVTVTITRILDLEHEGYEGMPYEDRLRQEIYWAKEMGYDWMDVESAQWETTGELIKDDGQGGTGE